MSTRIPSREHPGREAFQVKDTAEGSLSQIQAWSARRTASLDGTNLEGEGKGERRV